MCSLFFANTMKGETKTMYMGHIILQRPAFDGMERGISVYAVDCLAEDTICIMTSSDVHKMDDAKQEILRRLEAEGVNQPLKIAFGKVHITIPVDVKSVIFYDENDNAVSFGVQKIEHIGVHDMIQQKTPEETFTSAVYDATMRYYR